MKIWEAGRVPNGYWDDMQNRDMAIQWLEDKVGPDPMVEDYRDHGLYGLYQMQLRNKKLSDRKFSTKDAIAAYEKIVSGEARRYPSGLWLDKNNMYAVIRYVISEKLKLDPKKINTITFIENGLATIIPSARAHYGMGFYELLQGAYPELDWTDWQPLNNRSGPRR